MLELSVGTPPPPPPDRQTPPHPLAPPQVEKSVTQHSVQSFPFFTMPALLPLFFVFFFLFFFWFCNKTNVWQHKKGLAQRPKHLMTVLHNALTTFAEVPPVHTKIFCLHSTT